MIYTCRFEMTLFDFCDGFNYTSSIETTYALSHVTAWRFVVNY